MRSLSEASMALSVCNCSHASLCSRLGISQGHVEYSLLTSTRHSLHPVQEAIRLLLCPSRRHLFPPLFDLLAPLLLFTLSCLPLFLGSLTLLCKLLHLLRPRLLVLAELEETRAFRPNLPVGIVVFLLGWRRAAVPFPRQVVHLVLILCCERQGLYCITVDELAGLAWPGG